MKYSEKLIDDVRDYLMDASTDETRDYLCDLGYDWCYVYDLDDLYNDYCNGQLDEVINMFVSAHMDAYDGNEYYVSSYGEVCDASELEDRIWEELEDDNLITRLIDYALSGKINASSNLLEIINNGYSSWQDVDDALHTHFHNSLVSEREAFNDPLYGNSPNEFAEVCRRIEDMRSAFNCLLKTKFSNIPEERYGDIVSVLDANPNWLMGVGMVARGYMKDGIPFTKGVEMYLKVGSSWFREED